MVEFWKNLPTVWKWVASVVGAAFAAYLHFGVYWPAEPQVEPGAPIAKESSPVSPFSIKNPSVLFGIVDAQLTCYLNAVTLEAGDEKG